MQPPAPSSALALRYCLDAQPLQDAAADEESVRRSPLLFNQYYSPPHCLSLQSGIGLVVRSNAFTEYKASSRLYDTSAIVPGANVGSDPSRAFILSDESLLKTVRVHSAACSCRALLSSPCCSVGER
jgi:hypothetical protein